MKLVVEINFGNDAMQTESDAANALEAVSKKLRDGQIVISNSETDFYRGPLKDSNGQSIGEWRLIGERSKCKTSMR